MQYWLKLYIYIYKPQGYLNEIRINLKLLIKALKDARRHFSPSELIIRKNFLFRVLIVGQIRQMIDLYYVQVNNFVSGPF